MFISRNALFSAFNYCTVIALFSSCTFFANKELSEAVGKPGSLIIVSDQSCLDGLKTDLETTLLNPLPNLPSVVPFFELLRPDISDFNKFYYNQKTVLVLVNSNNYKEMDELLETITKDSIQLLLKDSKLNLVYRKDLFAKHQSFVFLFGNTANDLKLKINSHVSEIANALMLAELKDQQALLFANQKVSDRNYEILKKEYGIGVNIPAGFKTIKAINNFYWFQKDTTIDGNAKSIGLIIHSYPYFDSSDLGYTKIRTVRDTFCKYNIPGELKGTYMGTTESDYYPPRTLERLKINGYNTSKMRGWWTFRGLSMAGPFIRYVVYVPEKNILFVFEGFIYQANLNTKERDLRMIEAIALNIH